jgi:hypothetical protein
VNRSYVRHLYGLKCCGHKATDLGSMCAASAALITSLVTMVSGLRLRSASVIASVSDSEGEVTSETPCLFRQMARAGRTNGVTGFFFFAVLTNESMCCRLPAPALCLKSRNQYLTKAGQASRL